MPGCGTCSRAGEALAIRATGAGTPGRLAGRELEVMGAVSGQSMIAGPSRTAGPDKAAGTQLVKLGHMAACACSFGRAQLGDGHAALGDYDPLASLHPPQVFAEAILEGSRAAGKIE